MKNSTRPLRLEPVEDRLVPSHPFPPNDHGVTRGLVEVRFDLGPPHGRGHASEAALERGLEIRVTERAFNDRGFRETRSYTITILWGTDRNDTMSYSRAAGTAST